MVSVITAISSRKNAKQSSQTEFTKEYLSFTYRRMSKLEDWIKEVRENKLVSGSPPTDVMHSAGEIICRNLADVRSRSFLFVINDTSFSELQKKMNERYDLFAEALVLGNEDAVKNKFGVSMSSIIGDLLDLGRELESLILKELEDSTRQIKEMTSR